MSDLSTGGQSRLVRQLWPLLCFLIFLTPAAAPAAPLSAELTEKVRSLQLAADPYWKTLLHVDGFRSRSRIDDPDFFLSPRGKEDPAAELEATLDRLFLQPESDLLCRYPARYRWLSRKLELDAVYPLEQCAELNELLEKLDPRRVTLVFPGGHLNSPASMFGHTLLRIEGPYESPLLAYAVNYAAFTDESNGLVYAYKGIFGQYAGLFSILPYYTKVREYSDLEQRDIWEYRLNLSAEETRRMVLHIWELREIRSDYYFIDENCSYNLLFLLDAARPGLGLTARAGLFVIPVDTIRLVEEGELVEKARYRASKADRIQGISRQLMKEEKEHYLRYRQGGTTLEEILASTDRREGKAGLLELAVEELESDLLEGEIEPERYRHRYIDLLQQRSRLGAIERPPAAEPSRPETGHRSSAAGLAAGVRDGQSYGELSLRFAYHRLDDPPKGYKEGAQIEFVNLRLRRQNSPGTWRLEALELVNILSLSPREFPFTPLSWGVRAGFVRKVLPTEEALVFELRPAVGHSYRLGDGLVYLLAEQIVQISGRFAAGFTLGAGLRAGYLQSFSSGTQLHLNARGAYFPLYSKHSETDVAVSLTHPLGSNIAVRLRALTGQFSSTARNELSLGVQLYW